MRFCILGSGSSGNCALLQTEDCRVLVDAGFSARRIGELLERVGESINSIDAVFITHEHGDHCAGLNGLARRRSLKVFANSGTARSIQPGLKNPIDWQLFETGSRFRYRDLQIDSFAVPHDASDPVGFIFSCGGDDLFSPVRSAAWITDLGHAPQMIKERIRQVDILVIEANHDLDLLQQDSRRPWAVKQRIGGRHGHLSNASARELLDSIEQPRWQQVCLAHLSRDCNSLEAVHRTFAPYLQPAARFPLSVVSPGEGTPFYTLA